MLAPSASPKRQRPSRSVEEIGREILRACQALRGRYTVDSAEVGSALHDVLDFPLLAETALDLAAYSWSFPNPSGFG